MARPRRDCGAPGARERIVEAFWAELEARPVQEITVGAVTAAAGCSRATFYYHFEDMCELVREAVRLEIDDGQIVSLATISELVKGAADAFASRISGERLHRLSLVMRSGELPVLERAVREIVQRTWCERLLGEGGELSQAATFAIQYMVGGMLGFVLWTSLTPGPLQPLSDEELRYLHEVLRATVRSVARAEGMEPDEVVGRILRGASPRDLETFFAA